MELIPKENGIRMLVPSEGKRLALATEPNAPYDNCVYLGCHDTQDRYIEIDKPEPEEEPS